MSSKNRQSIRLKGWDYRSPAYYFITICTADRFDLQIFGSITPKAEIIYSELGQFAFRFWTEIPNRFAHVELDAFVIMPNHLHGIIQITSERVQHAEPLQTANPAGRLYKQIKSGSLGAMIRSFKSAVTRQHNLQNKTPGKKIWQRGYYERVLRNERELNIRRAYIQDNPRRWVEERETLKRDLSQIMHRR